MYISCVQKKLKQSLKLGSVYLTWTIPSQNLADGQEVTGFHKFVFLFVQRMQIQNNGPHNHSTKRGKNIPIKS